MGFDASQLYQPARPPAYLHFVACCHRVNNVLDLSSIEAGKLRVVTRPIFLRDVLLEVLGIMRVTSQQRPQEGKEETGVTCQLIVSESVPTGQVLADDTHLRQVRSFKSLGAWVRATLVSFSHFLSHGGGGDEGGERKVGIKATVLVV